MSELSGKHCPSCATPLVDADDMAAAWCVVCCKNWSETQLAVSKAGAAAEKARLERDPRISFRGGIMSEAMVGWTAGPSVTWSVVPVHLGSSHEGNKRERIQAAYDLKRGGCVAAVLVRTDEKAPRASLMVDFDLTALEDSREPYPRGD